MCEGISSKHHWQEKTCGMGMLTSITIIPTMSRIDPVPLLICFATSYAGFMARIQKHKKQ